MFALSSLLSTLFERNSSCQKRVRRKANHMKFKNNFSAHLGDCPSDISNPLTKLVIHVNLWWCRNIAAHCCRRTGGSKRRKESKIHVLGRLIVVFIKCTRRDDVISLWWEIIVGQFAWIVGEQKGKHNIVSIYEKSVTAAVKIFWKRHWNKKEKKLIIAQIRIRFRDIPIETNELITNRCISHIACH